MHLVKVTMLAGVAILSLGCVGATGLDDRGAVEVVTPEPVRAIYSPVDRGALLYGLPTAVAGVPLMASPRSITLADEEDLADDPVIKRLLVARGFGPSVIRVEQRSDSLGQPERPSIALSAVQLRGVPAEEFTDFVPSVYLLATSTTRSQHNLASEKPARETRVIGGRDVRYSDWGDFFVVWYPHGDVVYIVLADTPEKVAAALRIMPWPAETS